MDTEGGLSSQTPPWEDPLARGELVLALVRHGQTAWNRERRFLGCTDLPLDDEGRAQVAALGRGLGCRFARVYSSPLSRAVETARALDADPHPVDDLREMAQGELEGLDRDAAIARFPRFFEAWQRDPVHVPAPGGESLAACRDRARVALDAIAARHRPGELVAVVSHQMVIAALSCTIAGEPLARWREHGIPNASITVLAWDGYRYRLAARGWTPTTALSTPGSPGGSV